MKKELVTRQYFSNALAEIQRSYSDLNDRILDIQSRQDVFTSLIQGDAECQAIFQGDAVMQALKTQALAAKAELEGFATTFYNTYKDIIDDYTV